MTLEELKEQAIRSCAWRGHQMTHFDRYMTATCEVCGLTVYIDECPSGSSSAGMELGGSALAVDCDTIYEWDDG